MQSGVSWKAALNCSWIAFCSVTSRAIQTAWEWVRPSSAIRVASLGNRPDVEVCNGMANDLFDAVAADDFKPMVCIYHQAVTQACNHDPVRAGVKHLRKPFVIMATQRGHEPSPELCRNQFGEKSHVIGVCKRPKADSTVLPKKKPIGTMDFFLPLDQAVV